MNRKPILIGEQADINAAILPHDTDGPRGLSLGSRDYVMPFQDVRGLSQRVRRGIGTNCARKGPPGCPKLVAVLDLPLRAYALGGGPKTTQQSLCLAVFGLCLAVFSCV